MTSPQAAAKESVKKGAAGLDTGFSVGRADESKLVMKLVLVSAAIHLGVLLFEGWKWKRDPIVLEDDGGIVADLVMDQEAPATKVSSMPDANKGTEAKVPDNMLPQLPKKFKIDEPPPPDEMPAPVEEKKPEEKPKPEGPKPEEKPPEPEKKPEEKKPEEPPEPPKPEAVPLPQDDDATKMKNEDVKKRALLELLRQQEKTAKTKEAEDNKNPLAIAAKQLSEKGLMGGGKGGASFNQYGQKLKRAVQPNYNIPEVYRMRATEYVVQVTITVAATGQLMALEVEKSSGDQVFDDIVLTAIRNSVPLPAPPPGIAGEPITFNFSP